MSATVTDPLVGRLVDGRYEVVSRLARGGMATVYLAVDRRLDREVALKVMHPHLAEGAGGLDFVARFRREARTAAKLAHPGLVAVFDQGVDGETSYLTMEYIDGVNLRRRITDLGALPLGEALSVAEKVLDALSTAHRAGLVHRDIKPENVLIALDGRVKLADFGLARAVTEVTSTTTGTVLGTVAYLAPELVSRGESDARTDVYACGVLLYEMITGSQPFTGTTPIHVAFQHVNNDVPAPSDAVPWLPVEVDDLVRALAARDRDERVPDAVAALALLRRTRAGLDEETLERRADVPGSPLVDEPAPADGASSDDQETARFQTRAGATVALPIGLGLPAAGEVIAVEPRAPRRRGRTAAVVTTIVLLLAALGFAGWWFGMGPGSPTTVPAIAGSTQEAATSALDAAHLKAAFTEAFDATQPEGLVVSTDPEVGTQVSRDTTVNVVISKGPDWVAIPAGLVGMTSEDAQAALTAAGLAPSVDGHRNDDVAAAGTVLSATLPDGTAADPTSAKATRGTTVSLEISDGPAPVVIATITGMTADAATALLAKDALTLTTTEAYSDTVAAGVIISQDPPPSTTMHRGDSVSAVVSKGPEPVEIPTVPYGATLDDATKMLEDAGFKVNVEKASPFLRLNRVIGQNPSSGQAPKGSTITITIT